MMNKELFSFIDFIKSKDGIGNKSVLINEVQKGQNSLGSFIWQRSFHKEFNK